MWQTEVATNKGLGNMVSPKSWHYNWIVNLAICFMILQQIRVDNL